MRADGVDVPVCILSARDEVDDRVAGLQAGADDYLVKPFALAELTARLQRAPAPPAASDGAGPLVVGDLVVDPRRHVVTRGGRDARASRGASSSCSRSSPAIPARCSRASSCSRRSGATPPTSRRTSSTCSSATSARKLEAAGEPRMLHTVRGVGWVLRP